MRVDSLAREAAAAKVVSAEARSGAIAFEFARRSALSDVNTHARIELAGLSTRVRGFFFFCVRFALFHALFFTLV